MENQELVPNCPKCGRPMMKDRFDEWSCFNVNCAEEQKKRRKALNKRVRLQVKGAKKSIVKLPHGKTEIPVDFHGAAVKARKLGGYTVICPACGEHVTVTEGDIKNAGVGDKPFAKPVGPSGWETVAHGLAYVKDWNDAVAAAESGNVDYLGYREKIAEVTVMGEAWSFPLSTSFSTTLKLSCGHSIPITFGEDVSTVKEPDRVETFLKLGVKGEKSLRWMRYAFAGEDAPASVGEKKAREIMHYIQQLEEEKQKINKGSEKILGELERLQLFQVGFDRVVAESVNSNRDRDTKLLREAQLAELDRIDQVLIRVAKRPGAR
jgi:hypothetical protein